MSKWSRRGKMFRWKSIGEKTSTTKCDLKLETTITKLNRSSYRFNRSRPSYVKRNCRWYKTKRARKREQRWWWLCMRWVLKRTWWATTKIVAVPTKSLVECSRVTMRTCLQMKSWAMLISCCEQRHSWPIMKTRASICEHRVLLLIMHKNDKATKIKRACVKETNLKRDRTTMKEPAHAAAKANAYFFDFFIQFYFNAAKI